MTDKSVSQLVQKTVVESKLTTYTPRDGEELIVKKTNGDVYIRVGDGATAGGKKPLIEDVNQLPAIPYSKITGTPTTVAGSGLTDAVTQTALQSAIDNAVAGLNWKRAVRAATTANITLTAPQTIDGVVLVAGDRVLVKNQTAASANGLYVVAAAAWTRATDMDAGSEFSSAVVTVAEGTVGKETMWQVSTDGVISVGTTAVAWDQMYIKMAAATADALTTARTIALSGDATGSVSFNGSANVTIPVVITDDSHNHVIANVDGLQTALDAKSADFDAIVATPIV